MYCITYKEGCLDNRKQLIGNTTHLDVFVPSSEISEKNAGLPQLSSTRAVQLDNPRKFLCGV